MAYRMWEKGYLPNGNSRGWLHESCKFTKVMLFIEDIVNLIRKEQEEENGRRQRINDNP